MVYSNRILCKGKYRFAIHKMNLCIAGFTQKSLCKSKSLFTLHKRAFVGIAFSLKNNFKIYFTEALALYFLDV